MNGGLEVNCVVILLVNSSTATAVSASFAGNEMLSVSPLPLCTCLINKKPLNLTCSVGQPQRSDNKLLPMLLDNSAAAVIYVCDVYLGRVPGSPSNLARRQQQLAAKQNEASECSLSIFLRVFYIFTRTGER